MSGLAGALFLSILIVESELLTRFKANLLKTCVEQSY